MFILLAIIFISLSLSGYAYYLNNRAAAIPMLYSEGMETKESAPVQTSLPVDPATPSGGLPSSSYAPPVSATTSGQKTATQQALNRKSEQNQADQITAAGASSEAFSAYTP